MGILFLKACQGRCSDLQLWLVAWPWPPLRPTPTTAPTATAWATLATEAVGANQPYGYAASGHYRADSVGAVHIAKRSADPFYGHGYGYGYAGPVATGVSTVSHAGFPLQGYAQGYGYGH